MKRKGLFLVVGCAALMALAGIAIRSTRTADRPAGTFTSATAELPAPSAAPSAPAPAALRKKAKKEPELTPAQEKALTHARVFMQPTDEGVSVRGVNYTADVSPDGLAFKSGPIAVSMRPARLEVAAWGEDFGRGVASQDGPNGARVARGSVIEEYVFENRRVEQLFRVLSVPGPGELRVRIDVENSIQGGSVERVIRGAGGWRDTTLQDGGLAFKDAAGNVRLAYHGAVAIDAAGKRQELDPSFEDGQIVLAVPDLFMAQAAFPVLIDPWLELDQSASGGGISESSRVSEGISMALNGSGEPFIAWSDDSSGNFDIYVRFFNGFEWKAIGESNDPGGISDNAGKSSHPCIALDSGGNPGVAWDDDTEGDFEIYYRRWNGSSWEELVDSGSEGGISRISGLSLRPSVVFVPVLRHFPTSTTQPVDFDEVPMVAWEQDFGGAGDIYLAMYFPGDEDSDEGWYGITRGTAGGSTMSNGGISRTPGGVSEYPHLRLDNYGRPWVTWSETTTGNYEIYLAGFFNPAGQTPTSGTMFFHVAGGTYTDLVRFGTVGFVNSAAFTGAGSPTFNTGGDFAGISGSFTTNGLSNTPAAPSYYPSITFDTDHDVYVAWQEGGAPALPPPTPPIPALSSDIFVRTSNYAAGSTPPQPGDYGAWAALGGSSNVSNTGRAVFPSLAIQPGGIPVVAWQDDTGPPGGAAPNIDQPEVWVRQFSAGAWRDVGDAGSTQGSAGGTTRGISATTNLSYRPKLAAGGLGQFVCTWLDGALGSFDVFVKKFYIVDISQVSLAQTEVDGTAISVGGTTPDTAVTLIANVRGESLATPAVSGVRVQYEVRPIGTPFIGTPTLETGLITPTAATGAGNQAAGVFTGAPNVRYAWRGRAVDQMGRPGPWQSFGSNADSVVDFEIQQVIPTADPSSLDQRQTSTSPVISIPVGGTTPESSVVIVASIVPPNASTRVRLDVEVVAVGTNFTQTATAQSSFVSVATTVSLTHPSLSNGSYHWRVRAVPETGTASGWISFGNNPETDPDFIVQSPVPTNLDQLFQNGVTSIPLGGTSSQTGVVFTGTVTSPQVGQTVLLDIEVRPITTAFSNGATHSSALAASGSTVTVAATLPFDSYHWQARTRTSANTSSGWVAFGANASGQTDFRLFVEPPAPGQEHKKKCGLLGAEMLLLVGALALMRRRLK